MATLSPSELLDWLGQNQFLSAAQTDELRPIVPIFPDSYAFAKDLMRRDWLTAYQVNQILQGKHDQLVLGGYRLRERIGEGAMGQVFKAWSLRLERMVAVKTILKEMVNSPKALERFRREVETASQLKHPNIALVRDADEADGRSYLVMDFIEGIDLSQRVKQKGALPIAEAVEYIRQAALGLQYAHEQGIVHRDIKPANLMVATLKAGSDSQPVVKILDFGLARYESERDSGARLTQVGKLLGTIDYVAPEQAQDARKADIRADIYSLGCSLFYLLTARPPFLGENVVEKLGPRLTGEAPWVREVRSEISPALEEVLRKMMARRPEDRYQTPAEAAQALEPHATAVALAMPLATPATAGVMLAQPVQSGAITAGSVPMAMPVLTIPVAAAAPAEPAQEEDPAFLRMTATGRDMSSGPAAVTPRAMGAGKPFPIKLILIVIGALLVSSLLCVGTCLYFPKGPKKSEGVIHITKAIHSVPSNTLRPGDSKFVLVEIKRDKFKGPVKITLLDLPPGVTSTPKVIPANNDRTDVAITVSYGTDTLEKQIRVHAECEAEGISAHFPLQLTIVERK